ncbi:MAG: transcription termination/antitermination protein NusG [Proteobacteria bacterium]|nr:transcription termination/antitermination protein NusG [Pseudomonadota bacterium]MCH9758595.1 transcription termination/antitermination protein NusG [Pseudomonadota bacterium]
MTEAETMANKEWYALHVTSGFEQRAKDGLIERIERNEMAEFFGEILLPIETRLEIRRGQKKELGEKMFPGYLFIEMQMQPESWHLVRNTRWINGFIGGSQEHPRPLSTAEIEGIRARIGAGIDKPVLRAKFLTGDQVRIKEGPFSDFNGTVDSVNLERERLVISVMVFGRSTPVDLDFDQAEKI